MHKSPEAHLGEEREWGEPENPEPIKYTMEQNLNTKIDMERILQSFVEQGQVSERDMEIFLDSYGYNRPQLSPEQLADKYNLPHRQRFRERNDQIARLLKRRLRASGYGPEPQQLQQVREQIEQTIDTPLLTPEASESEAPTELPLTAPQHPQRLGEKFQNLREKVYKLIKRFFEI